MKKEKMPIVVLSFYLNTGIVINNSSLSPVLGQYGIKGIDFCNKFNKESLKYFKKETLIKVLVPLFKDKSYIFLYKMPPLFFLFKLIQKNNIIYIQDLYKICLIKSLDVKSLSLKIIYKNILNTLKTYKYELYY